ncbi:hypothetical protein, partial [Pseudomonas aeruginosa]|uniref:hypothetical protein n=1 Tax=Pseudomonas aeruginosa TaxID=287 RepID=UPI0031B6F9C3
PGSGRTSRRAHHPLQWGAAVSSVMAFSSAILISIFLGRRVFPMPALPGKDAMKIALSVLLMAVSVASFSLESAFFGLVVKVVLGRGADN